MTQTKICTRCLKDKPLDDFSKAAKGRFGRNAECRLCWALRAKAIRELKPQYAENDKIRHKQLNDKTLKTATVNRQRWSQEEERQVKEYWDAGFSAEDIAIELGRSYQSVMWRVHSVLNLKKRRIYKHDTETS